MNILEICTDASLKTFVDTGRVFTCSGAISINSSQERYVVTSDSTNNRGELLGVYLGVKLAHEELLSNPGRYDRVYVYSDSQFAVYGLRDWMKGWIKTCDANGIIYGSNNKPVKNQELFMMIITYCVTNKLKIYFFNQKGHVNTNSSKALANANMQFKTANGFLLRPDEIFKISFFNDIVDKNSRNILDSINPDDYPIITHTVNDRYMCRYIVPDNFKQYIR